MPSEPPESTPEPTFSESISGQGPVQLFLLPSPEYQTTLTINGELHVHYARPMPSLWLRFWYRLLLGWRWTPYAG